MVTAPPRSPPDGGVAARAGWRSARRLLAGPLRILVTGQVAGQFGDGLAQITFAQVVLFEAGRGATPWELAKLLAVTLLPFSLIGPFAGVFIDRWDRRRTLVVVSMVRVALAACGVAILALDSQALAYAGVLVLLSTSRFVLAAKGAVLPRTVDDADLVTANAVSSVGGLAAAFTGAVIGSAFVAAAPAAGFVVAGGAYLLAAASFRRLPPVGGGAGTRGLPIAAAARAVAADFAEEVHTVFRVPAIRRPLLAVWAHRLLLGAGFVVLVLTTDARYRLEAPGYGLALAVTGVAAFAGTVAAPGLARRFAAPALLTASFMVAGLAAALAGFDPALAVFVTAVGVVAFAFQVLKIVVDALVQHAAPDFVRGRTFSAYDVLYNVAFVLAALALVPVWRAGRERPLLWLVAAAFVGAGALSARAWRVWPFETGAPSRVSVRTGHRWRMRLACSAAGAVPALAFPQPSWWWLAAAGFVPLLLLVLATPSRREAGMRGWFGGAGFFAAVHSWLVPNIGPFVVPAALLLGAFVVPWALAAWTLLRSPLTVRRFALALVVVPAAWTVAEYVRSWDGLGGPWGLLGASLWQHPVLLSPAALGGVWLLGYLLMAVAVAATAAMIHGNAAAGVRALAVATVVVIVASTAAWSAWRPDPAVARRVLIAGVQPGVVRGPEARFAAEEAMTLALAPLQPDLVVWGESSVGIDLDSNPGYLQRIEAAARTVGADILVNVDSRRAGHGIFKSSVLVSETGPVGRYDKMRLVPFGEYIPARPVLGWLAGITEAASEDRRRGHELVLLHTSGSDTLAVGPLVCFESAFPDLTRSLARMGADVVIVQSATSTFQDSWAPAQHASLAAVRAVESGRSVVHATLTGISAAFDASGHRLAWSGVDHRGTWTADVPLTPGDTPYDRVGDWLPALAVTALLVCAVTAALRAGDRRRPAEGSSGAVNPSRHRSGGGARRVWPAPPPRT